MANRQYVAELLLKLEAEGAVRDATTVMRGMKRQADQAQDAWRETLNWLKENADIELGKVDLTSVEAVTRALKDMGDGQGLKAANGQMMNLKDVAEDVVDSFTSMRAAQDRLTAAAGKTVEAQQFLKDVIAEQKAPLEEQKAAEKAAAKEVADAKRQASKDATAQRRKDAKAAADYERDLARMLAQREAEENEMAARRRLEVQLRTSEQVVEMRRKEAEAATQALRDAETATGKRGNAPEIAAERELATEKNRIFIEAERERLQVARQLAEQEVAIRRQAYERAANAQAAAAGKGGSLEKMAARDTVQALEELGEAQVRVTQISEQQSAMRMQAEQRVAATVTKTTLASQNVIRIIQDAPYGMMGITNNLQAMGESLGYLMNQIDPMTDKMYTFGGAVRATMGGLLKGPMLVSLIITVLSTLILQWDKITSAVDKFIEFMGGAQAEIKATEKSMNELAEANEKAWADDAKMEDVEARFNDVEAAVLKARDAYYELADAEGALLTGKDGFNAMVQSGVLGLESWIHGVTGLAGFAIDATEAQLLEAKSEYEYLEAQYDGLEERITEFRNRQELWNKMDDEARSRQAAQIANEIIPANEDVRAKKEEIAAAERLITQAIKEGNDAEERRLELQVKVLNQQLTSIQALAGIRARFYSETGSRVKTQEQLDAEAQIAQDMADGIARAQAENDREDRRAAERQGRKDRSAESQRRARENAARRLGEQQEKNAQILAEALVAAQEEGIEKEVAAINAGYLKKRNALHRGVAGYQEAINALNNAERIELNRAWRDFNVELAERDMELQERLNDARDRATAFRREFAEGDILGDGPNAARARAEAEARAAEEDVRIARERADRIEEINAVHAARYDEIMGRRATAHRQMQEAAASEDMQAWSNHAATVSRLDAEAAEYEYAAEAITEAWIVVEDAEGNHALVRQRTQREVQESLREEAAAYRAAAVARYEEMDELNAALRDIRQTTSEMAQASGITLLDVFGITAMEPGDFDVFRGFSEQFEGEIARQIRAVESEKDRAVTAAREARNAVFAEMAGRKDADAENARRDAALAFTDAEIDAIRRAETEKERIEAEGNARRMAAKRAFWSQSLSVATSILDNITQAATMAYQTWAEERGRELDALGVSEEEKAEIIEREGAKQFEAQKKLQIAQAWISGLQGAVAAVASTAHLGPAGWVMGGLQAAAILALTKANVNRIKAMKPGGAGGGGSSSAMTTGSYGALGLGAAAERVAGFDAARRAGVGGDFNRAAERMEGAATRFETTAGALTVAIEPRDSAGIVGHGSAYNALTDGNR